MKWRVIVKLTGSDGIVRLHEVSAGGTNTIECSAGTVGLTLADGRTTDTGGITRTALFGARPRSIAANGEAAHHCGSTTATRDIRARRLLSLFGTVEVPAPRFLPCRCAVTHRHTVNPVAEIIPDRCTPEYERAIAKMGSLLPYARARTLLAEFLPLGDVPAVETTRRRTLRVGARFAVIRFAPSR